MQPIALNRNRRRCLWPVELSSLLLRRCDGDWGREDVAHQLQGGKRNRSYEQVEDGRRDLDQGDDHETQ